MELTHRQRDLLQYIDRTLGYYPPDRGKASMLGRLRVLGLVHKTGRSRHDCWRLTEAGRRLIAVPAARV